MPDPTPNRRGHLKVYLGYAAGVGKTYQMLADAQDLAHSGGDVVIGYFESHGRADTILKAAGLEVIPRRQVEYRGAVFEEMDVDAILRREPQVCLVDELAHTNVPGSGREKRWEDALALLERGIDVFTTVNIQHVESLNDQVWNLTGIRVRETVPDWVIKEAAEVVMVDATPQALINRLLRGAVYAPEKARRALENFFKESTLVALREMALRETAHEVEVRHVTPAIFDERGRRSTPLERRAIRHHFARAHRDRTLEGPDATTPRAAHHRSSRPARATAAGAGSWRADLWCARRTEVVISPRRRADATSTAGRVGQ
jgi:K+-sensing histidine kinase KdpD